MLELVDHVQIASVLVVDDSRKEVESIIADLDQHGCAVGYCASQSDAHALLSSGVAFDLVVLDWHLEAEDSMLAGLVLQDISEYCLAPVAVWTNFYDKAKKEVEEETYEFPEEMIFAWQKSTGAEGLRDAVVGWLNSNPQARLALLWSRGVRLSLSHPIRELLRLQQGELGSLARYLRSKGFDSPALAGVELLRLLQSLLARQLLGDSQLAQRILTILEPALNSQGEMTPERFGGFLAAEMYAIPAGVSKIRTGDVIDVGDEQRPFVTVLTPACDLVHANPETDYVLLARAVECRQVFARFNSDTRKDIVSQKKGRYHFLPFVPLANDKVHLIVDFQDVQAPLLSQANERITEGAWTVVATLESPYRENLVQRYVSLTGRIGLPDLPAHIATHLAGG